MNPISDLIPRVLEKSKAYAKFIEGLMAVSVEKALTKEFNMQYVNQAGAYKRFGRKRVEKWVKEGMVKPLRRSAGRVEYSYAELIEVSNIYDKPIACNNKKHHTTQKNKVL